MLQLFRESWFSTFTRGLGCSAAVYDIMISLLWQSFLESLKSGLSSEKLLIWEILHFTNFNRNLVYFLWIKDLAILQVLITLNGINMTPVWWPSAANLKIICYLKKYI